MDIPTETTKIADTIPFSWVVILMEKVSKCQTSKEKIEKIQKRVKEFRDRFIKKYSVLDPAQCDNDSIFCIMRFLLPDEDKSRAAFGFKDKTLAKYLVKALGLGETTPDGKKLQNFKTGDLGSLVHDIVNKTWIDKSKFSDISVGEMNRILDDLAQKPSERGERLMDRQHKILLGLMRRVSPRESRWFVRIVLKDNMSTYLGLNDPQILKCMHPQANDLYKTITSLEEICLRLNDTVKVDITEVHLFEPFQSKRCARLNIIDDFENGHNDKGNVTYLPTPPFFVEIKWNGERTHIHYDASRPFNDQFRFFSRNNRNFTSNYEITLTPRLLHVINPSCTSFILDGEMMAYNKENKKYTQKTNRMDVKTLGKDEQEDDKHCPCYVAYDLVYYNGVSLINMPFFKRTEILQEKKLVVEPKDDIVVFSKQRIMHSKGQVFDALNSAIDDREEGIVIKERDSVYKLGSRDKAWLKLKPEYYKEHAIADLDLLILGAYYAKSNTRSGTINHFLVGILDPKTSGKEEFYPMTTVGSGKLKLKELEKFVKEELEPKFVKNSDPNFNIHWKGITKPDFYVNPKNSIVLQARASEIVSNDSIDLKYTLVTPVLELIRLDKDWDEVLTVDEFHSLRVSGGGKLARRNDETTRSDMQRNLSPLIADTKKSPGSPLSPLLRFRNRNIRALSSKNDPDSDQLETTRKTTTTSEGSSFGAKHFVISKNYKSQYSKGKNKSKLEEEATIDSSIGIAPLFSRVFHVVGSPQYKSKVEKEILHYGGKIVQNPTKEVYAIIAEKLSLKVNQLIKQGTYNIMKYFWFEDAIDTGDFEIEDALPEHVWFSINSSVFPRQNKIIRTTTTTTTTTSPTSPTSVNTLLSSLTSSDTSNKTTFETISNHDTDNEDKDLIGMENLGKIPSSDDDSTGYDSDTDIEGDENKNKKVNSNSSNKLDSLIKSNIDESGSETDFEEDDDDNEKSLMKFCNLQDSNKETKDSTDNEEEELNCPTKIFKEGFLNECKILFRSSSSGTDVNQLKKSVEFFNGKVALNENEHDLTHIVIFDETDEMCNKDEHHSTAFIVRVKWLLDSLEMKQKLDETPYLIS